MDFVILIIIIVILAETSLLVGKSRFKKFGSEPKRKVYIDTSVLMDGRILKIAETGFIGDKLIIPSSVIRELQLLADGREKERRTRARYGLDTLNALERVTECEVEIYEDALDRTPVDDRLIELAKANNGMIFTNDFNLNKVATAEKVQVLNINELAMSLASIYEVGDVISVRITETGANPGQGVGHLEDGTMVVVDNASTRVKQNVNLEIQRCYQTASGRMIFGKPTKRKVYIKSQKNSNEQQNTSK